jgi:hypothetical protein
MLKRPLCCAEIQEMPRFADHEFGQPSSKLFIKNLAKGIKVEDLAFIFGRYFDSDDHLARYAP